MEIRDGCIGEIDLWWGGMMSAGSMGYEIRQGPDTLLLIARYENRFSGPIELPIPLEVTRPHFGGLRWWGRCPLVRQGRPCRRRVGKLYVPLYDRYFGCRQCYGLTYQSAQEQNTVGERQRRESRMRAFDLLISHANGTRDSRRREI
jgi:hypothetical protein